jgi:hypothetical protein
LSAENLFEAMTTGHPCPPQVSKLVMQRIENHKESVRVKTHRPKTPKAGSIPLVIPVIAVAMGCLAVAWLAGNKPAPSVSPPTQSRESAPQLPAQASKETGAVPKEPNDDVNKRWTFEKGVSSDLKLLFGAWDWRADDGGQMVPLPDVQVVVRLPISIPTRPMVIKMKCINPGLPTGAQSFSVVKGNVLQACRKWATTPNFDPQVQKQITYRVYVSGKYQVHYCGDQINSVMEYKAPVAHAGVLLLFRNVNPQDIEVTTISPDELPKQLRDIPKLIETLGVSPLDVDELDIGRGNP